MNVTIEFTEKIIADDKFSCTKKIFEIGDRISAIKIHRCMYFITGFGIIFKTSAKEIK